MAVVGDDSDIRHIGPDTFGLSVPIYFNADQQCSVILQGHSRLGVSSVADVFKVGISVERVFAGDADSSITGLLFTAFDVVLVDCLLLGDIPKGTRGLARDSRIKNGLPNDLIAYKLKCRNQEIARDRAERTKQTLYTLPCGHHTQCNICSSSLYTRIFQMD